MKLVHGTAVLLCVVSAAVSHAAIDTFPSFESFEHGFGIWQQSTADDFDWSRNAGVTPSSGTGPYGAYDGLWYVYTEASGNNPSRTAILAATFNFGGLTQPMLSFRYHMYGANMGALYIDVDDGTTGTSLWAMIGEQQTWVTDAWRRAQVSLAGYAGHTNVTIRIRGVTGAGYTSDMAVDKVQVFDDVPRIELDPQVQQGEGIPDSGVNYNLAVINESGGPGTFSVKYFNHPWATVGPVTTGPLTNGARTDLAIQVQIPAGVFAGVSATSLVQVTGNGLTGVATLATVCSWTTHPLPCETWDIFPHGWTNYYQASTIFGWLQSAIGNPAPGLYHPAYTVLFTNWFVSPAIDLSDGFADTLKLAFDELAIVNDGYDYTGVWLSDGSRDPSNGDFEELLEIGGASSNWVRREVDLTPYKGSDPVYLAFLYIGSNSHLALIDNVCISGDRTGIDQSFYDSPVSAIVECTESLQTYAGRVYAAGETGPSGPAPHMEAQLGLGTPGTAPDADESWRWYPASYSDASGIYDAYEATPALDMAGDFDVCMRYRRGLAEWVYADRDGSSNGYSAAQAGHVTILPQPPPGNLIYRQTMDGFGWWASVLHSNEAPDAEALVVDNVDFSVNTSISGLRWRGVYDTGARRTDTRGFLVKLYRDSPSNAVTSFSHPGPAVHTHYTDGLACERMFTNLYGIRHFEYQLELPAPWTVGPGRYWLSIQIVSVSNDFDWYWLDTEDPVRGSGLLVAVTGTWVVTTSDLGFELTGAYSDHGVVSGRVTAAHSGKPVYRAHVAALGTTNIHATTGTDGRYGMLVPLGIYTIQAAGHNFVTASYANVYFTTEGQYRGENFALNGSLLMQSPAMIEEVLHVGEVRTNTVTVMNTGPLSVSYRNGFTDFSVDTGGTVVVSVEPSTDVHIPRFEGMLGESLEPPSSGPPPVEMTLSALPLPSPITATLSTPAYGTEIQNRDLILFDTHFPGADFPVGNYGSDFVWASDFLPGQFDLLYAIRDNNQFVTIATSNAGVQVLGTSIPSPGLAWTGMAADQDGSLYACATDVGRSELYRIDPIDGYATLVGEISNSPGIIAIAIDTQGTMYGHDIVNDSLLRIDKYTGAGTIIGPLGFNANFGQGMDYDDRDGILYLAAFNQDTGPELRIADVHTGATSNVGAFSATQVGSMAVATSNSPLWVSASTDSGDIGAGRSNQFEVIFDSNVVSNKGTYRAHMVFSGSFVNEPVRMPLTMHIADGLQLSAPSEIDFGAVLVNTKAMKPLKIKNTGFGAITGALSGVVSPFGVDGGTNYILAQLEGASFDTWFSPTGPGTFTNAAKLSGAGGQQVRLVGIAAPTLAPFPTEVRFPETTIDETNTQVVLCENIGGGIVSGTVSGVSGPFHLGGTTNYVLKYGDATYFTVAFIPRGFGHFRTTLQLSGGGDPMVEVSGQGVPEPAATVLLLMGVTLCMRHRQIAGRD